MKLSVIISNRNDVSMLVVTIRSCIEELIPLGEGNWEIVVVDNSNLNSYRLLGGALPTGYCRDRVLKVFRQEFPCLFTARETAAEKASGEYIACIDSHMLVGRNCFIDLVSFMDRHKDDQTLGFAHSPINWAHQHERSARHDRDMSINELGGWNTAYDYERTITWKGMPWICRRDWFLDRENGLNAYGALAEHRVSWGGGDMHIGIKPWLLGFENWAVPTRPCIHIGPFPRVESIAKYEKYRVYADSGQYPPAFGFLISCYVLGGEPMMQRNDGIISERFGQHIDTKKWKSRAIELGENEKQWLDKRKIMSFEQLLESKPWEPIDARRFKKAQ